MLLIFNLLHRAVATNTHSLTHSFTHSLTHSLTHSTTYSLTQPLTHSPTNPPTDPPTHPLTHSLTISFTCSLTHSHLRSPTVLINSFLCEGRFGNQQIRTSMPSSESRGIHPRRLQMRPTFTSTGNSCMRKHSSMMHATLLRPRPAPHIASLLQAENCFPMCYTSIQSEQSQHVLGLPIIRNL